MVKEIGYENNQIFNFKGLVTLTLDRVILHTIVHHSSTSCQISLKSKKLFVDKWTYVCMYTQTVFIRSTLSKSRPKKHPTSRTIMF